MTKSKNDAIVREIATWIEREATENPHSEIRVSLHVHGGKVAKIERGTISKLTLSKSESRTS